MKNNIACIYLLLLSLNVFAQRIDNTASWLDIKDDNYFRFHYDNDFFTSTDLNYTQGYTFELVTPWLKRNPVNILFPKLKESETRYGISFEQTGFTPASISADEILYGDRPYAATIALKSFVIVTDTIHKSRLTVSLTTGMIGPVALGDEMQTGIHKWIDDDLPQGWKYQIKNDIILDYELTYEKQLFRFKDYFAVTGKAKARLGTLNTNVATGLTFRLGLINAPFESTKQTNKLQVYLYGQPMITAVGYDATLQGGIFNKNSPYKLPYSDIEKLTAQYNYGIVLQYQSLFLEYSQALLTREFTTGHSHKWGGFKIGFKL
ncbi:lipid A deacylase LpxR family protein [Flavobacterium sp. LaA7.5]|nr:lipid A deacylase LpxR family protein [Flavobacterium salilacus subsp. altitudinum]